MAASTSRSRAPHSRNQPLASSHNTNTAGGTKAITKTMVIMHAQNAQFVPRADRVFVLEKLMPRQCGRERAGKISPGCEFFHVGSLRTFRKLRVRDMAWCVLRQNAR